MLPGSATRSRWVGVGERTRLAFSVRRPAGLPRSRRCRDLGGCPKFVARGGAPLAAREGASTPQGDNVSGVSRLWQFDVLRENACIIVSAEKLESEAVKHANERKMNRLEKWRTHPVSESRILLNPFLVGGFRKFRSFHRPS
jgi:hypothetical protein